VQKGAAINNAAEQKLKTLCRSHWSINFISMPAIRNIFFIEFQFYSPAAKKHGDVTYVFL
jgi:hypothetical protein